MFNFQRNWKGFPKLLAIAYVLICHLNISSSLLFQPLFFSWWIFMHSSGVCYSWLCLYRVYMYSLSFFLHSMNYWCKCPFWPWPDKCWNWKFFDSTIALHLFYNMLDLQLKFIYLGIAQIEMVAETKKYSMFAWRRLENASFKTLC